MSSTININNIIQEIEALDYTNKINVMSKIVSMLKHSSNETKSINITKLKGLGKEVWQDVNIENYIAKEREAWD
ncbi:MAG: hypothetical protein WCL51_13495 [Bacteroidota bacterium]